MWYLSGTCLVPDRWYLSGTCLVPVWYLFGTRQFSSYFAMLRGVVPVWYLSGTCLVPVWYLSGTCLVPVSYPSGTHLVPVRYPSGTRRVPVWYPSGTRLVPVWCPSGTRLVPVWYPSGTRLVPAWHHDGVSHDLCGCQAFLGGVVMMLLWLRFRMCIHPSICWRRRPEGCTRWSFHSAGERPAHCRKLLAWRCRTPQGLSKPKCRR